MSWAVFWAIIAAIAAAAALWAYFRIRFAFWKRDFAASIRRESIAQSQATIIGKVTEHLAPFLPDFQYNPKDVRFIGSPVDLIVFDGLEEGSLRRLVFVEVKAGKAAGLTARERDIREAILSRAVPLHWDVFHVKPTAPG
jgi:predicted Holliday junction resolvase-like endonuclease